MILNTVDNTRELLAIGRRPALPVEARHINGQLSDSDITDAEKRRLELLMQNIDEMEYPSDDSTIRVGSLALVTSEIDFRTQNRTLLISGVSTDLSQWVDIDRKFHTTTVSSPAGDALLGATAGQTVEYIVSGNLAPVSLQVVGITLPKYYIPDS